MTCKKTSLSLSLSICAYVVQKSVSILAQVLAWRRIRHSCSSVSIPSRSRGGHRSRSCKLFSFLLTLAASLWFSPRWGFGSLQWRCCHKWLRWCCICVQEFAVFSLLSFSRFPITTCSWMGESAICSIRALASHEGSAFCIACCIGGLRALQRTRLGAAAAASVGIPAPARTPTAFCSTGGARIAILAFR